MKKLIVSPQEYAMEKAGGPLLFGPTLLDPAHGLRFAYCYGEAKHVVSRSRADCPRGFNPVCGRQLFNDGPYIDPPVAALTAITSTSIEDMWPGITWTPIFANDAKAGKIYCVRAGGTLSLTGGTFIVTPQWGPAGTTLGASLTQGTSTITIAGWYLAFDLLVQSVGAAGANSKVIGTGYLAIAGGVVSGTGLGQIITFGGTQASVDTTINGNVTIRKTASTTNSMVVDFVYIFSRN